VVATPRESGAALVQDLLFVEGMFCAACAAAVEHRLSRLPGVVDAAVDLVSGAALLRWSPGRENHALVDETVRSLGYGLRRPGKGTEASGPAPLAERLLQLRFILAVFFGMWAMLPSIGLYLGGGGRESVDLMLAWGAAFASLPVVTFCGLPFYRMAFAGFRHRVAGIDALVTLGVAGALILSAASLIRGEAEVYFEVAVALITLQLLARLVELKVLREGRDAVASLLKLSPQRVTRLGGEGAAKVVPLAEVREGDRLIVEPGETVVADGRAEACEAILDRSSFTGETRPVPVAPDAEVYAGERVLEGPLIYAARTGAGARRIDHLGRQARNLLLRKRGWQRGIDAIARRFLGLSLLAAALGAALAAMGGANPIACAERALAVFVIACPCALSLAAPLTAVGTARRAADRGFLLRDLRAITAPGVIDVVFVDKTGTLTAGRPRVRALIPRAGIEAREVLAVAAAAEGPSRHPFARAIVREARRAGLDASASESVPEGRRRTFVGRGVRVERDGRLLRVGSGAWLGEEGISCPAVEDSAFSRVWVARDQELLGAIELEDPLRDGAAAAIESLKGAGVEVVILSGDASETVASVADDLNIEGVAACSPEDKVDRVAEAATRGRRTAFVGDGLNDGPALAAAHLGVAVETASDAARAASAVTLERGGIERLPELLQLAAAARRTLCRNIVGAVLYNAVAIPAALVGWVHPAVAAIAMAASSLTVVIHSYGVAHRTPIERDALRTRAPRPRGRAPTINAGNSL